MIEVLVLTLTKENKDDELLTRIESVTIPELRKAYGVTLERALMDSQHVLTESAFLEKYERALNLYRTICKESGEEPKL